MNNTTIIECQNIRKAYHDGDRELVVLKGVDLKIPAENLVAITGPSGVGKSTLLHIMGTLDTPTDGDVFFRGEPIRSMSSARINHLRNKEIGFVFQFYHLLPEFTALENVMMPALNKGTRRRECASRGEELLIQVGLKDRMKHKPGQLSGGEQQRVAIARALFNHPAVLFCDEPTGNLDENTGSGIVELLCELNNTSKVTLVIVTHDESIAHRADLWITLHDGKAHVRQGV